MIMNQQDQEYQDLQIKHGHCVDKIYELQSRISSNTEGIKEERDKWINEYKIKNDMLSEIS